MRVSPERLRARELPRVIASRAFRRRLLQGLGVVAVLAVVFRWLLGLSPGPESPWALAGLTVLWSLYAVREALDHAAGHRPPRTRERPPRAAARCDPADKPTPRGRVPWRDLRPGFLPVLGPGLALLAVGGGRYGVALCLAVGSGLAALVDAVSFAARCHRDLPDAPRTAVQIVGFTDPVGRGLVLQPVAGGPCLAVADAWNWREDLATGDVLTWLGLWDAAGQPWRPPVRALCCPGRTHLVRHVADQGDRPGLPWAGQRRGRHTGAQMAPTANSIAGLVIDPALQRAWLAAVPGAELVGIAGAGASTQGCVVVVSDTPVDDAAVAAATPGLAAVLGVRAVEVVVATGVRLADLVRDWTYQAAQGSGRGVHVQVSTGDGDGGTGSGPVRVLARALDSSARELAFRLASPQEPALPALRALLGGREVTVEDEESLPQ